MTSKIKTHELKCLGEHFKAVLQDRKKMELRLDDGRNFLTGDLITLKEWKPRKKAYTGREIYCRIAHVLWICHFVPTEEDRWVILSIEKLNIGISGHVLAKKNAQSAKGIA